MLELVSLNFIVLIVAALLFLVRNAPSLKTFRLIHLLTLLLVLAGALFVLNKSVNEVEAFLERREWPIVAGEITSLEVVGNKTREPAIQYRYHIEETPFEGVTNLNTPFFSSSKSQDQASRTILSAYSVGDTVIVYFNPQKYEESVLKVTPHLSTFMQYSFALLLAAVMLALLINRLLTTKEEKTI